MKTFSETASLPMRCNSFPTQKKEGVDKSFAADVTDGQKFSQEEYFQKILDKKAELEYLEKKAQEKRAEEREEEEKENKNKYSHMESLSLACGLNIQQNDAAQKKLSLNISSGKRFGKAEELFKLGAQAKIGQEIVAGNENLSKLNVKKSALNIEENAHNLKDKKAKEIRTALSVSIDKDAKGIPHQNGENSLGAKKDVSLLKNAHIIGHAGEKTQEKSANILERLENSTFDAQPVKAKNLEIGDKLHLKSNPSTSMAQFSRIFDAQIVSTKKTGDVQSLHIKLHPDDLGSVDAKLRLTHQGLHIELHAERDETARLLAQDRYMLDKILEKASISKDSRVFVSVLDKHASPVAQIQAATPEQNLTREGSGQFFSNENNFSKNPRQDAQGKMSQEPREALQESNSEHGESSSSVKGASGYII